jgi:hypothetical protein
VANLVLTDGNSLLSPDEINMLVTLQMNRNFMQFMRENHAKDGQHKRLLSEIRPAELGLYCHWGNLRGLCH